MRHVRKSRKEGERYSMNSGYAWVCSFHHLDPALVLVAALMMMVVVRLVADLAGVLCLELAVCYF
jgi:hypothetical protein